MGEGGCVCGKVSRLAARKPCFRGRRADQERFSASGQATVRDPYGTQLEKIRFPRFGFGSRETLDEGSISHVRSPCQNIAVWLPKISGPRLFCNSRPQAARGPVPRAEPTGARREEARRATYSSAADESRRTRRATGSDRARSSPSSGLGPIAKDRRHRAEAATNNRGTWVSGAPSAARTCAAPRR